MCKTIWELGKLIAKDTDNHINIVFDETSKEFKVWFNNNIKTSAIFHSKELSMALENAYAQYDLNKKTDKDEPTRGSYSAKIIKLLPNPPVNMVTTPIATVMPYSVTITNVPLPSTQQVVAKSTIPLLLPILNPGTPSLPMLFSSWARTFHQCPCHGNFFETTLTSNFISLKCKNCTKIYTFTFNLPSVSLFFKTIEYGNIVPYSLDLTSKTAREVLSSCTSCGGDNWFTKQQDELACAKCNTTHKLTMGCLVRVHTGASYDLMEYNGATLIHV